ncbi:hypothetical protein K469DRAFT_77818 [Zopfia rhizophila CBS 207.26]|uniref:Uncharacterized protein n=1 Tax=Zopfia rhizophila CBS 207.26 TaxID=1314779 RepID=A0A6A6DAI3_9PEZI|nr:hypothetical protein K469DRAFT_77818 [Zopfia rhizophila CBS 207.26]
MGLDIAKMVRTWWLYQSGQIAGYIKAHKRYEKEGGDYGIAWIEWQLAHQRKCNGDGEVCKCPPPPKAPVEPFRKDYQAEKSDA